MDPVQTNFQDLLDLKDAELDSLRLELEETKGRGYLEYAKSIETELSLELEKQATLCSQLELSKKQLETTNNSLRVTYTQLDVYTKNREIEEMTENHQKELGKAKKEWNLLWQQKKKTENDAEDGKKQVEMMEKEVKSLKELNEKLVYELKSLFSTVSTIKADFSAALTAIKTPPKVDFRPIYEETKGELTVKPQSATVISEFTESRGISELDKVIRMLSQGSLT